MALGTRMELHNNYDLTTHTLYSQFSCRLGWLPGLIERKSTAIWVQGGKCSFTVGCIKRRWRFVIDGQVSRS